MTMTFEDTTSCPGFRVQILNSDFCQQKPGRRDAIVSLVSNCFCQGEPLCQYLGIQKECLEEHFVQHIVDKAIQDELSLVCVDPNDDDRVVAVMLNEDFYETLNNDIDQMVTTLEKNCPEMLAILELMGHLDDQLFHTHFASGGLTRKTVLHAFMGCTAPEYAGRGLATRLRALTIQFAKTQGFSHVCVEPTNPITLHIWTNKLGGTVEYSCSTKDFTASNGTRPFSRENECMEQETAIVMVTV